MKYLDIVNRSFQSFVAGETFSFERRIGKREINTFAALSGDRALLHMDDSYAATTGYGKRIAHGQLVAAPISTMAGHLVPGKRGVLLEVRSSFVSPVYPGDLLTYTGTIVHISPGTQTLKIDVLVTNKEGMIVLKGAYTAKVLPDNGTEVT